ncbi:hypothetical protein HPB50_004295 [Hyalomma asiaticum]|uniref:Uncharacterized protein n=1 Tax=Hyalomma asiaticum TaxID=266040 RepID=A0ACB7S077_HYAAI|nr:hypothetical protein HPB50_004295 [Hyalomma asiaticum]
MGQRRGKRKARGSSLESPNGSVKMGRQDTHQQEDVATLQLGTPTADSDMSSEADKILGGLLSRLRQQTALDEACLSNIQEILVDREVGEEEEQFLLSAKKYLEEKTKTVLELVPEIDGALQCIAENQ